MDEPETLERLETDRGEWVLRRRRAPGGPDVFEIIANGVFLMDSREHGTEAALAHLALREPLGDRPLSVLVGGLGFGYTLRAVLDRPGVGAVTVAEVEPAVVRWVRGSAAHLAGAPLTDARVRIEVGDVADLLARPGTAHDAILLDVDNGPEFLVHESNRGLYAKPGLSRARRALRPGGRLAIWSSEPSPACLERMGAVFDGVRAHALPVAREGRHLTYFVYVGQRGWESE